MGTLFGFVVGYVIGARSGNRGYQEVVDALRQVRESSEFRAFLDALRGHAQATLRDVSERLSAADPQRDLADAFRDAAP